MKHRDEEDKATIEQSVPLILYWNGKIHGEFHCSMSWSRKIPRASSFGVPTNVLNLAGFQNFAIELQLLWHRRLWKQWTKWGLRNSVKGIFWF